ncbi:MAG TPA: Crp/Fnr family transcriptional regulator [Bacteroidales bacterium]|jgi:CRP-like cAMP-binding protein|nr:Crp/Fnr family transcriptional regulator [Bacteroidales bacterium]MDD4235708.1 Crp/Fnr family transcriptional regulator [Bacteroidales bacterium]MDY0161239.1 Crp/Fnr family transcriptional regulator [Bacteroidales bacterium]HRW20941.1 Crp/Fnr family transcriptional regulator [Bacteroidales bacterium]HXK81668.1 Crp/Fnr family transcriptional regulator [Bacteroidales bacterium]
MYKPFEEPLCKDCNTHFKTIFRKLSLEQQDFISSRKSCAFYKKGTVIYKEGQRTSGIYCINQGIVKIYKTGVEGKEQIIKFAKCGDVFGYRSILNGEPACTSVKVNEDAVICHVIASDFYAMLKENSEFGIDMLQLACAELGEANSYITDIAQKSVRERLAEILVYLKDEFGVDDDKMIKLNLTREELANLVGTATESVIRLLSEFKNDGLVELKGRRIRLINLDKLNKIGNIY